MSAESEAGPVEISRGKIVAARYKILHKLGEGGCGTVYKVEDLKGKAPNNLAALKAESNNVAGGTVLKLEVQVGFVHRDLKPANIAIGRRGTPQEHFLHILDFGLVREFVVKDNGKMKMRRPRGKALFRGTTRYCSIDTHEKIEQGRVDDLWSFLYLLAELRGTLPWTTCRGELYNLEGARKSKETVQPTDIIVPSPYNK